MAQVPYSGTPDVNPTINAPDDEQRIRADPSAFGSAIAQGEQQLGAGASKASQFFGQVQTDDAVNGALDSVNKSLNSFRALNGQDALNAQKPTQDAIDAAFKSGRDGLTTPEQQLQYDQATRSYQQRYVAGIMSTHADEQAKAYSTSVNNSALKVALDGVTNVADDDTKVDAFRHDARGAAIKNLQLTGNENDPTVVKSTLLSADQAVYKTQAETVAVKDPVRALALVEQHKVELGPYYSSLADQFRSRAEQQKGLGASANAIAKAEGMAPGSAPAAQLSPSGSVGDAASVVRHFEGLRTQPYWDVNHWRTGYGSDTITRADGSVEPVTAMTGPITKEDAERDLQRRVNVTQRDVQGTVGQAAWSSMPAATQASLTSVAYNYGHLPASVAAAARGGDQHEIASAIAGLGGANGGVNAKRRAMEAGNVLGKFGVSGVEMTTGPAPTMVMPEAVDPLVVPVDPVPPPAVVPTPPDTTVPAPPSASPAVAAAPVSPKSNAYQTIIDQQAAGTLNHSEAQVALAAINQHFTQKAIEQEQDAKAKKDAANHALDGYVSRILKNQLVDLTDVANDPALKDNAEAKMYLARAIEEHARQGGDDVAKWSKEGGSGYWNALKAIHAPEGDPIRISDPVQLLQRVGPGGDLTMAGYEKLSQVMNQTRRSVDDAAVNRTKVGLLDYAKTKLSFEQDTGPIKIRDPKGEALFNSVFIPKFEAAFDQQIKAGKDPWQFLTRENVDKMVGGMRSQSEMERERLMATGETAAPEAPNTPLPPAPPSVDPEAWTKVVSSPPPSQSGTPWTHAAWGNVLNMLVSNPSPENIALFNASKFGKAGYDGATIVRQLSPRQMDPHRGPSTVRQPAGGAMPADVAGYEYGAQ